MAVYNYSNFSQTLHIKYTKLRTCGSTVYIMKKEYFTQNKNSSKINMKDKNRPDEKDREKELEKEGTSVTRRGW